MIDILGTELKVGDIVAHGTRAGNSGDLNIKVIAEFKQEPSRYGSGMVDMVKVINYNYVTQDFDRETRTWSDVFPHYEKGGTGWSSGYSMLVVNESVNQKLKDFLKGLV